MKKILHFSIGGLVWLAAMATPVAQAWTYQDGDALLIFRGPVSDDVEFDLGSINQFLGHSAGYHTQVTDWSTTEVANTFGSVSGVSVAVVAVTSPSSVSPAAWLSSAYNVASVSDVSLSTWHSDLYSFIDAVGADPTNYSLTPASANSYVIASFGDTKAGQSSIASYDYIVSDGGQDEGKISDFGGNVPFDVEGIAPATFGLWQIGTSSSNPKPAATYIGTFDLDANNNLYFYVGSLQPNIIQETDNAGSETIKFTTLANGSYSVVYSPDPSVPESEWIPIAGPVNGNNGSQSLSFSSPGDPADYYAVVRSP
jgi:hypothetical protein